MVMKSSNLEKCSSIGFNSLPVSNTLMTKICQLIIFENSLELWTQIRADKMPDLIWIQTVWHSVMVFLKEFLKWLILKYISKLVIKSYPACKNCPLSQGSLGAQWLSGRVLNSRLKGRGLEPHRRHFVVVLEQDTFTLA